MESINIFTYKVLSIKAWKFLTKIGFSITHHALNCIIHIDDITISISNHGVSRQTIKRLFHLRVCIRNTYFFFSCLQRIGNINPLNHRTNTRSISTNPRGGR